VAISDRLRVLAVIRRGVLTARMLVARGNALLRQAIGDTLGAYSEYCQQQHDSRELPHATSVPG